MILSGRFIFDAWGAQGRSFLCCRPGHLLFMWPVAAEFLMPDCERES